MAAIFSISSAPVYKQALNFIFINEIRTLCDMVGPEGLEPPTTPL